MYISVNSYKIILTHTNTHARATYLRDLEK